MTNFKPTILKTSLFATTFVAALSIVSCGGNMEVEDSKEIAEESNNEKFENAEEDDADFLVSAAEINLEEIQLGQLAQTNSSMPDVIELGKMMEEEHTKALEDLKILADKKQITIPTTITTDGMDAYDKLKDKVGVDFDKAYCDMMVNGHEDAIREFEKGSTDSEDSDIKSWASTTLVSLRNHLDHSVACQDKCAKIKSETNETKSKK